MKPYPSRAGLVLLLSVVAVAPSAVVAGQPAPADRSPFGDPYPVFVPDVAPAAAIRGPHVLREDLAILLVDGTLWRTDATPEGTFDIQPSNVRFSRVLRSEGKGRWLTGVDVLTSRPSLWFTDGTAAGTRRLRDALDISYYGFQPQRGLLFFTGGEIDPANPDGELDWEPWVSDGTASGTRPLGDLVPGGTSGPQQFQPVGDSMAFLARDPDTLRGALWRSDGTLAGTRMVAVPEGGHFFVQWTVGSAVYLHAAEGFPEIPGGSLWRSDGTPEGTVELRSFPQANYLLPAGELDDERSLWKVIDEDGSAALWVTGGAPETTARLMPLAGAEAAPVQFIPFGGAFYFVANDGTTGFELWKTDGTPEGTEVAFESCPGTCSTFGGLFPVQDGSGPLLIYLDDAESGLELRTTDGTAEGTELLLDLCPGPCSSDTLGWWDVGGLWVFSMPSTSDGRDQLWASDLTPEGTYQITEHLEDVTIGNTSVDGLINGRFLFLGGSRSLGYGVWAIPVAAFDPPPPLGPWLRPASVAGFELKVRITGGGGSAVHGFLEPGCIPETACISGAVPGRSEVFARVVGPKPNGFLWPTLVKFTTSEVEVWVRQQATGAVRYYLLEGAAPGFDLLPGLLDRTGFEPVVGPRAGTVPAPRTVEAPPPPAEAPFVSDQFPGFRFRARITGQTGQGQAVRMEAACIEETMCLSGAVPGRSELFLRIVGPKPNGRLWPTLVKFTTSEVEVWIEQVSTGETRYYRMEGAAPGRDELVGLFDRQGFLP